MTSTEITRCVCGEEIGADGERGPVCDAGHDVLDYAVGSRLVLKHDVDRYPHFIAPKGATGTVVHSEWGEVFCVRMDEPIPGAEDWDNEVIWSVRDGDDPTRDVKPA
jgi:hypothetical protein